MTGKPVVYSMGLVYASVCVPADWDTEQVEAWMNLENPTGVACPWKVSEDKTFRSGQPNPCPCESSPDAKKHWLMSC